MYRQTRKRSSAETPAENSWIQKTRPLLSRGGIDSVGRRDHGDRVRDQGQVGAVILSALMFRGRSKTGIEEDGNRTNLEREEIMSMEADDLEATPSVASYVNVRVTRWGAIDTHTKPASSCVGSGIGSDG